MKLSNATDTVYEWCSTELPDLTWWLADQNNSFSFTNSPNGIGVIKLLTIKNDGRPAVEHKYNATTDKIETTNYISKILKFSVNIYSKYAIDEAELLRNSIDFYEYTELFFKNSLGHITSSEVRNLTDLISSEFETRGQFDIDFYVKLAYSKEINRFVKARILGDFNDGEVSTDQTITI